MPRAQAQKENYRQEKRRATRQLLSALTDPGVVIMADSLKVGAGHPRGPGISHSAIGASRGTLQHDCPLKSASASWGALANDHKLVA